MEPVIGHSIRQIRENFWVLGTLKVCEIVSEISEDSIASWKDNAGKTFNIRNITQEEKQSTYASPDSQPPGVHKTDRVHRAGHSAAVWRLGDAYFKVKSWVEGMERESDTIAFVKKIALSVPVPEVLCTWIDHAWERSFIVLRKVKGQTLQ
jgi:hypothetical protein